MSIDYTDRSPLTRLDSEIAALTRESLRHHFDAQKAWTRKDMAEVKRLQELAEVLSQAADDKAAELSDLIEELVSDHEADRFRTRQRRGRRSTARGAQLALLPAPR